MAKHILAMARAEVRRAEPVARGAGKVVVALASPEGMHARTSVLAPLLALATAPARLVIPLPVPWGQAAETCAMLEWPGSGDAAPIDLALGRMFSQQMAAGRHHLVIDLGAGPSARDRGLDRAVARARLCLEVGRRLRARGDVQGLRIVVTNHDVPPGLAYGRLAALQEMAAVLRGETSQTRLTDLSIGLAARLLLTAGVSSTLQTAEAAVRQTWHAGRAYPTFVESLRTHGTAWCYLTRQARYHIPVHATQAGHLWHIDVRRIVEACRALQAGGESAATAGIVLGDQVRIGAAVLPGTLLAIIGADDQEHGERVAAQLQDAFALYQGTLQVVSKPAILADYWLEGDDIRAAVAWQRESRAALGLTSRQRGGQRQYLCRYNRKWGAWHFVAGHFEPAQDHDFRDTMIREFIEETGAEVQERPPEYGRDFTVAPLTPSPVVDLAFSGSAQQWTKYEFHLFRVALQREQEHWDALWQRHPETFRWLSPRELIAGVSADRRTVLSPFPLGALRSMLS